MNDNNTNERLSVTELEELCQLYLDCRLTRLQEQELHLVLLDQDVHSPLIDEVRGMMGFELRMSADAVRSASLVAVRRRWWQRWSVVNIAASHLPCQCRRG